VSAVHPTYGPPIAGRVVLIGDTVFRPYKAGFLLNVRCSDDHRITIFSHGAGYVAFVDGAVVITPTGERKRFGSVEAAGRTAVQLLKAKGTRR
jgi:ribosomal protein S27E